MPESTQDGDMAEVNETVLYHNNHLEATAIAWTRLLVKSGDNDPFEINLTARSNADIDDVVSVVTVLGQAVSALRNAGLEITPVLERAAWMTANPKNGDLPSRDINRDLEEASGYGGDLVHVPDEPSSFDEAGQGKGKQQGELPESHFAAGELLVTIESGGKRYYKVSGKGKFPKYPMTVWPEVLARAANAKLDPKADYNEQAAEWAKDEFSPDKPRSLEGWTAYYTTEPYKVVRLEKNR